MSGQQEVYRHMVRLGSVLLLAKHVVNRQKDADQRVTPITKGSRPFLVSKNEPGNLLLRYYRPIRNDGSQFHPAAAVPVRRNDIVMCRIRNGWNVPENVTIKKRL